jgi:hypothetical protein
VFNYYKDKETRSSKYSFSYQLTTFTLLTLTRLYIKLTQPAIIINWDTVNQKTGNKNLNPLFVK